MTAGCARTSERNASHPSSAHAGLCLCAWPQHGPFLHQSISASKLRCQLWLCCQLTSCQAGRPQLATSWHWGPTGASSHTYDPAGAVLAVEGAERAAKGGPAADCHAASLRPRVQGVPAGDTGACAPGCRTVNGLLARSDFWLLLVLALLDTSCRASEVSSWRS